MNTSLLTELYNLYKTLPTLQQAFLLRIYKDSPLVVYTGSRPCATELGDIIHLDEPGFAVKLLEALDEHNLFKQPYHTHPDFAFIKTQFDTIVKGVNT